MPLRLCRFDSPLEAVARFLLRSTTSFAPQGNQSRRRARGALKDQVSSTN